MNRTNHKKTEEHKRKISLALRGGLSGEDYFWSKVNKTDTCWEWISVKNTRWYGKLYLDGNGKKTIAHRYSWEMANGEIPEGLHVLHHCDNPPCIRPDHLFLGTDKDNVRDMISKKRNRPPMGAEHYLSKLTENQVRTIRKLWANNKNNHIPQWKIGEIFNVATTTVSHVVKNRTWKHI